ncbi:hypothetical protein MKW98_008893 [Papaver atlanticum]|uniref:Uncharacterized protein n=1 Tax=Papaver atlanticum TaxID=357466 RepID=A0AAD4S2L9_9MAGN|nr:hypothetical protein MKW98_008893 [Papaver atlanticum]
MCCCSERSKRHGIYEQNTICRPLGWKLYWFPEKLGFVYCKKIVLIGGKSCDAKRTSSVGNGKCSVKRIQSSSWIRIE